jgi:hypothetical protein
LGDVLHSAVTERGLRSSRTSGHLEADHEDD